MHGYFYHFEGPWFASSQHRIMINMYKSQGKLLYCDIPQPPYCVFRGFEPGSFKMVKISMKKFISRLEPVSFREDVQDATTEL